MAGIISVQGSTGQYSPRRKPDVLRQAEELFLGKRDVPPTPTK